MNTAKPFNISKKSVQEAYERVKANKGAAGIDDESITDFGKDLKNNLYKIWNRMSSGSYFPPPVRMVEIPKSDGRKRKLGIPTVADRIAQMVAKLYLEPELEPHFHEDSYGYRPNRSAHDAIGKTRERCWQQDWVLDIDIQNFFDDLNHEYLMRAVKKHTESGWLHLYIERWLKAPIEMEDGQTQERIKGTPQGGVISPLLANLFLHYAFDKWMKRNHPQNLFERYADDVIVHCSSLEEAYALKELIEERLEACGLKSHPEKTQVVYCKDDNRKKDFPKTQFDFLGYTFRPRFIKSKVGKFFVGFTPAISKKATKSICRTMKKWKLQLQCGLSLEDIAKRINPILRGWINYYGRYHKTAIYPIFCLLNKRLVKWARRKYKKFRTSFMRAMKWLEEIAKRETKLFAHWQLGVRQVARQ